LKKYPEALNNYEEGLHIHQTAILNGQSQFFSD
jgi:hypothetical protein